MNYVLNGTVAYASVLFVKVTLYSVVFYGRGTLRHGWLSHRLKKTSPRFYKWLNEHYSSRYSSSILLTILTFIASPILQNSSIYRRYIAYIDGFSVLMQILNSKYPDQW